MIFLSKLNNMALCRSVCFTDDAPRLNRNTAIIIPTSDKDVYLKIINKFRRSQGRLRIKGLNYIFRPKMYTFRAGTKIIKYIDKDYRNAILEINKATGATVHYNTKAVKDFNCALDYTDIINKFNDPKVSLLKSNSITLWKALINFQGLTEHNQRYLYITPEIVKVNIKTRVAIKASMFKTKELYLSLLYHLIYDWDNMLSLFRENNCGLIVSDGIMTFRVDFNDPDFNEQFPDKESFFTEYFLNMRKMKMGIDLPEDESNIDLENIFSTTSPDTFQEEVVSDDDTVVDSTITKTMEIVSKMKDTVSSDTLDKTTDVLVKTLEDDNITTAVTVNDKEKEDKTKDAVKEIKDIVEASQKKDVSIPQRLAPLADKQQKIKDENLVEILARLEDIAESMIEPDVVKEKEMFGTFSINKLDEQYAKIAKKDRLDIAESFNSNSVPLYLTNYKDELNTKATDNYSRRVQMTFESPVNANEKHTFSMNIPTLREGKFLHINGSDKVMIRQKMALPIIRLDNRVVMTSYYNKMFMDLTTGNLSKSVARIKAFIKVLRKDYPPSYLKKYFSFVPAYYTARKENLLGPELLELSRFISHLEIDENNWVKLSAKNPINNVIAKVDGIEYMSQSNSDILINRRYGTDITVLELFNKLMEKFKDEKPELYKKWDVKYRTKTSDNISYSRTQWGGGRTPTIYLALHASGENLLNILEIMNNDYGLLYEVVPFTDKPGKGKFLGDDGDRFFFKNFTLDVKYNNVSNRHLLQPLHDIDLSGYDSLILTGIIEVVTSSSNTVLAMETNEDLFWDPITKKVMEDCGIPTDYTEALLYANSLLCFYDRTIEEISLKNERMPSNEEIIAGVTYKCMADEYRDYAVKVKRGSKMASFSVQQDAVMTALSVLPNVEESSKINSIQHVDKLLSVSNKGISGVNDSRSYTILKRKWDKSFYGIMSDVSPYGPGTGITKHLSVNPNIKDIRGYFISETPEETKPDQMMAISEALRPFSQKHDSSPRTAMSMMQSNHLMGTEGSEPALVTYGMDERMSYLDSDFAKRLKDDGEIVVYNDRYIKIRYNNLKMDEGTPIEEIIELDSVDRNSAKAFFIPNKLKVANKYIGNMKAGTKVRKNEIIAYNPNFYQESGDDIIFKSGPIVNIAIMNTQYSYEDSTVISESLAKKLQTKVLKRIALRISPRHQIKEVRTLLGPIHSGDTLIKVSEDSGSDFLNKMYDTTALEDHLMRVEKSNYNGILRDIYVYYKLSESDEVNMDKSIKDFMTKVDNFYKRKYDGGELSKNMPKYELNRTVEHVTKFTDNRRNSVNGDLVNKGDILIEFFIEVNQNFSSGDKLTIGNTALKGVNSKIISDDQRPIGVKTGKPYDLILSTYSPLSRMIYSTFLIGPLTAAVEKINDNIMDIIKNHKDE